VRYSIDTSAILDGWRRFYPPDVFPALWQRLETLVMSGDLAATEEVLRELERKDDEVCEWAKAREGLFVPIDEPIQVAVADLLGRYRRLVNDQRNRSMGDPWVIALAQIHDCTVVSGEQRSGNLNRPKIPDVCDALGIRCVSLLDLIREQRWLFK
jgi:hypothetical protein